ncbi:MAG: hypothetical protein AAFP03_15725, partial [Cyanobacteria bacterium J06598_3]
SLFISPLSDALTPSPLKTQFSDTLVTLMRFPEGEVARSNALSIWERVGVRAFNELNDDSYLIRVP